MHQNRAKGCSRDHRPHGPARRLSPVEVGEEYCKRLSAKADSFSPPDPDRGGREVWPVYSGPAANVDRSDGIGGSGVAAEYTGEQSLRRSIGTRYRATSGANLRGVSGVNYCHQHPGEFGFVLNKPPELIEGPRIMLPPLAMPNHCPVANTFEFFQSNTAPGAFSLCNNTLGDAVIDVSDKSLFFLRTFLEKPPGSFCLFCLKLRPQFGMAFSQSVDLSSGIDSTIRVGGDVDDTQVNAEKFGTVAYWWLFHFTDLMKIKLPIPQDKVSFTTPILKKLFLSLPGNKGNFKPATGRPDRDNIGLPRENSLIVSNAAMPRKKAFSLSVEFIGISNLCQNTDDHLCGKLESGTQVIVEQPVESELAKGLSRPRFFADVVSSIVGRLQGIKQCLMLLRCRLEFNLGNQFHIYIVTQYSRLDKEEGMAHSSIGFSR